MDDLTRTEKVEPARFGATDAFGMLTGLAVAILAMTPSLLPRLALFQGVIAAVAFAVGYLVGASVSAVVRRILRLQPIRMPRWWWFAHGALWLIAVAVLAVTSTYWQNEVRRNVEMAPLDGPQIGLFLVGFVPLSLLLITIGKLVRGMWSGLRRNIGTSLAWLASATVVTAVLTAVVLTVMVAVDSIYLDRNGAPSADVQEPASDYRSAGPESVIDWQTLGRHGANFVSGGPSAEKISALTGRSALTPIRVYAGLETAPTMRERADLVVAELERTGAFERSVLVVLTPTGSGWVEPQSVDSIEYLHAGNTAIAAMQYAYTPSWVSFLFDPDVPIESSRILFDAVHEHWSTLPVGERPLLLVHGLSLGAHGAQSIFDDLDDLRSQVDGALFVGSPNNSELWRSAQAARDPGSPAWQPVLDQGRQVRWFSRNGDEKLLTGRFESPRVAYLQHATDPVTWLNAELLWRSPEWLEASQRGDDVSQAMRWVPIVTGLQVTVDMLGGTAVPARHGHNFGDVYLAGWRAISGDAGLDDQALQRIQAEIESLAPTAPSVVE